MTFAEIDAQVKEMASKVPAIGATFKFDFGDDGVIFVDGTGDSAVVSNENKDADCNIIMTMDTYNQLRAKEINPMMAMMSGKINIKGR